MSAVRKAPEPASEQRVKAAEPLTVTLSREDAQEWASWLGDDGARLADLLLAIEGLVGEANAFACLWREATGQSVPPDERFDCAERLRNDAIEELVALRENSRVIRDGLYEAITKATAPRRATS